jgi:hypothetical protein
VDDNGQPAAAPIQLVMQGTVTSSTVTVLPGGGDGQARTGRRATTPNSGYAESADVNRAANGSAFTACIETINVSSGAEREMVALSTSGAGVWQTMVYTLNGGYLSYISIAACGGGTSGFGTGTIQPDGAHVIVCVNYNEGGDNKYRLYLNGSLDATTVAYSPICGGGAAARHALGGYWNAGVSANPSTQNQILGGFYTPQALTSTQIAALSHAVLADVPTGAKGETLTFTRPSLKSCPKSDNTAVSVLPNNRPCITNGGLLVESSRTNAVIKSQQFDDIAWTNDVTPTADFAIAPDGTTTADRYQFIATGAGARSVAFQSSGCPNGASTVQAQTLYVKGTSTSGTIDLCSGNLAAGSCAPCSFTNTSWTRCVGQPTSTGAPGYFLFGNATVYNGGTTRVANDVLVWGAQCEAGAYATSYIPTTTAASVRSADAASVTLATAPGATGSASIAFNPEFSAASASSSTGPVMVWNNTGARSIYPATTLIASFDTVNNPTLTAGFVANTTKVYWSSWSTANGWVLRNSTDATQSTSAFNSAGWISVATSTLQLAGYAGWWPDGVIKAICYDPSEARCRR